MFTPALAALGLAYATFVALAILAEAARCAFGLPAFGAPQGDDDDEEEEEEEGAAAKPKPTGAAEDGTDGTGERGGRSARAYAFKRRSHTVTCIGHARVSAMI